MLVCLDVFKHAEKVKTAIDNKDLLGAEKLVNEFEQVANCEDSHEECHNQIAETRLQVWELATRNTDFEGWIKRNCLTLEDFARAEGIYLHVPEERNCD